MLVKSIQLFVMKEDVMGTYSDGIKMPTGITSLIFREKGYFIFKNCLKIGVMILIAFIPLSLNVVSMRSDEEPGNIKTTLRLAEQGDSDSQYKMGLVNCRDGATVENLCQAAFWFGEAAKNGHASATQGLRLTLEKMDLAEAALKKEMDLREEEGKKLNKKIDKLKKEGEAIDKKYDTYMKAIDEAEANAAKLAKQKKEENSTCTIL